MSSAVRVTAGSRLHFGLLRFDVGQALPAGDANAAACQAGKPDLLCYGGLGLMIAEPRTVLEIAFADCWSAEGDNSARALDAARRAVDAWSILQPAPCFCLRVTQSPEPHCGFGSGTQLALAAAAGVRRLLGLEPGTAEQLAAVAQRGQRSAVGSHGFVHGGLIWESGRRGEERLGSLSERIPLNEAWRIVTAVPTSLRGLSGPRELDAFAALPPIPLRTTERLIELAERVALPAAQQGDCREFGRAVYEFGRISGECFSTIQGGAYASPELAQRVAELRHWGVAGVGQSSWGPAVFAIVENEEEARQVVSFMSARKSDSSWHIAVTRPLNTGAFMENVSAASG